MIDFIKAGLKGVFYFVLSVWLGISCNPIDGGFRRNVRASNDSFQLECSVGDSTINMVLTQKRNPLVMSDAPYVYRAQLHDSEKLVTRPDDIRISRKDDALTIHCTIVGLQIEQQYAFPPGKPYFEEHILIRNPGDSVISLSQFELGFQLALCDSMGFTRSVLRDDRMIAVPFRHRADDPEGAIHDFRLTDMPDTPGWEYFPNFMTWPPRVESPHHFSEAWAWMHGGRNIGIFHFNQEHMTYSVISHLDLARGRGLRFGGACYMPVFAQPSFLQRIMPGDTIDLGVTRYQSIAGGYNQVAYAYREMLDEYNCRFPDDFNPPVHWNQLYNMRGAWDDRQSRYTKQRLEEEAEKAVAYECEALYLDPGWDTKFGTFIWGVDWMGPRKEFIQEMKADYGLEVSLHTPMPPWSSVKSMGPDGTGTWPAEARRLPPPDDDTISVYVPWQLRRSRLCMGSDAFLDEAEKRLLANCADGVVYLMFDGVGWNGPCADTTHGHPVPYLQEDHMRTCIDLAQRIHRQHPDVLIEMHDMLDGGTTKRMTPVYYKYGLPGSYDENWAFELMWNPIADIKEGRGLAAYYYNLACNVPLYLHVDLQTDNEHCLVLWWFASTVRHLGIGGSHKDPAVVAAQQEAMHYYRQYDRFYKRGDFYGIDEEIHLHVLPEENAFMVNAFNLSDEPRTIAGRIDLNTVGLNENKLFDGPASWVSVGKGHLAVQIELAPWGTAVCHVEPVL